MNLQWPAAQTTLLDLHGVIDVLGHRREHLEREIVAILPGSPWETQVGRLRCLRGVDTLTAVGLCCEDGDSERFARAGQLMSYLGLVPSESTTGNTRRLGSITKTGSAHARRLLVEAAWHYRKPPRTGKILGDRQAGQPAEAIAPPSPAGGSARIAVVCQPALAVWVGAQRARPGVRLRVWPVRGRPRRSTLGRADG